MAGQREPNGRLQRPTQETGWEVMQPVLERRCRDVGIPATVENMRKVRGEAGGTPWGRLWLAGRITSRQYEAFKAFANLRQNYLRSIDAPKEDPKTASMGAVAGATRPEDVSAVRAIRARYLQIDNDLRKCPASIVRAAFSVIRGNREPDRLVQLAGTALAILLLDGLKKAA